MRGTGQATKIQFAIPTKSIGFWADRFIKYNVKHESIKKKFGLSTITFFDNDGLQLELVMFDQPLKAYVDSNNTDITSENAITGFFGIELSLDGIDSTEKLLTEKMGYKVTSTEGNTTRLENINSEYAKYIDLFEMNGWPKGIQSAGTVYHVAFRFPNDQKQEEIRKEIESYGLEPTEVIDRNYFHSIYFREPGGVLFEIATDNPGFTVDEELAYLGTNLKLPKQYEGMRPQIESILPVLDINTSNSKYDFVYKYIDKKSSNHLFFLHSMGGDETTMLPFGSKIDSSASIISIRGNVQESGMNRFFRRFDIHNYDLDNLEEETEKLHKFITDFTNDNKIDLEKVSFVAYSNGANLLLNLLFNHPDIKPKNFVLLHPMLVKEPQSEINLEGKHILITKGLNDPFQRDEDEIDRLVDILENSNAEVEVLSHEEGHNLMPEEIEKAKEIVIKS